MFKMRSVPRGRKNTGTTAVPILNTIAVLLSVIGASSRPSDAAWGKQTKAAEGAAKRARRRLLLFITAPLAKNPDAPDLESSGARRLRTYTEKPDAA